MLVNNILTFRTYDSNMANYCELAVPEFDMLNIGKSKNVADAADIDNTDGINGMDHIDEENKTSNNTLSLIYYTPFINGNTLSLSFVRLDPSYYQNGISDRPDCLSIVSVKIENTDNTSKNANNIITNNTITNNTIANNTITNNAIANNTITNNTIANNTITNNTIANNAIANNAYTNSTHTHNTHTNDTYTNNDAAEIHFTVDNNNYSETANIKLLQCINNFKLNDMVVSGLPVLFLLATNL